MIKIIKADERHKIPHKISMAIFGPSGVGKTTLARTLDPETTLFIDAEAGTLALGDWPGDIIDIRKQALELNVHPWALARALACWLGGPNPADVIGDYSEAQYQKYVGALGPVSRLTKYTTVFVDSITVASRMCLSWSKMQPSHTAANGKPGRQSSRIWNTGSRDGDMAHPTPTLPYKEALL